MSQPLEALEKANRVRLARAELKRRIAAGDATVASVLTDTPDFMATMTVTDLLMSQHRWGRTRAKRLLAIETISETKAVGTLTRRQAEALVRRLEWLELR